MSVKALHSDEKIYAVKASLLADLEAIDGDPTNENNALRKAKLVVKGGTLYKRP
jgi:imidazolonepropionase-like amidohydrolase